MNGFVSALVIAVVVLVLVVAASERMNNTFDESDSDFQSYLSVCTQANYDVERCLFAWQYPVQSEAIR